VFIQSPSVDRPETTETKSLPEFSAAPKPAARWLRGAGFVFTAFAVLLNAVNAPGVALTVPKVHNFMGVLWLFGTHAALALAWYCGLVPRLRKQPLTQQRAGWRLVFGLLSVLTFPLSYGATVLFASGGINRLF